MPDQFSPDAWLTSLFNALTDFIASEIDASVQDNTPSNAGLEVYEISMDFPASKDLPRSAEFNKTIIHFVIDDIDNRRLGLGHQIVNATETPAAIPGNADTIQEQEARSHTVNFDVGVWASDLSGGSSSRLRAYEMLDKILNGDIAREKCFASTGGVEIIRYNAGRFVTETTNEIRVFRIVGAELEVRVVSREMAAPGSIVDSEPDQQPDVDIGGVTIT